MSSLKDTALYSISKYPHSIRFFLWVHTLSAAEQKLFFEARSKPKCFANYKNRRVELSNFDYTETNFNFNLLGEI